MPAKKMNPEESFVKNFCQTNQYNRAKSIEPNLWQMLEGIRKHYVTYSGYCAAIVQQEIAEILKDSEKTGIHSVRSRIKQKESLCVKIVKKKAYLSETVQDDYNIEKYRDLNAENYYKIITDIGGIRILIRYREQWETVHAWIWNRYFKGEELYLHDFVKDYKSNVGYPFMVERPKIYYRNDQNRAFYEHLLNRKKDAVTVAAVDAVDFQQSSEGYNSIHYVVNVDGKYIEIQVRTLLDEAWAECTHDIVYKNIKNKSQIMELQYLSNCLAQQTTSAEMISNLIYEKVYKNGLIYGGVKHSEKKNEPPDKNQTDMGCEVERRMQLLQELSNKSFGGNTDEFL